jgi:hypothetical protein
MDDANKLRHLFGNADHNLDRLVRRYGSEAAAGQAILDAIQEAYDRGDLIVDALGNYRQVFCVGGYSVTVRGRVVNGIARIGSAWIPPSASEDGNG